MESDEILTTIDSTPMKSPGPDADVVELREHYMRVQEYFATHAYDDWVYRCHWCLGEEQRYPRLGTHGNRLFCSIECQRAYAACLGSNGTPTPAPTVDDDPVAEEDDTEALMRYVPEQGSIGNGRLHKLLRWDTERYIETRDRLVAEGRLALGRGRGGSVRRVTDGTPAR